MEKNKFESLYNYVYETSKRFAKSYPQRRLEFENEGFDAIIENQEKSLEEIKDIVRKRVRNKYEREHIAFQKAISKWVSDTMPNEVKDDVNDIVDKIILEEVIKEMPQLYQKVYSLMLQGFKNSEIAKKTNYSDRHIRRIVVEIKENLKNDVRIQALYPNNIG